MISHSDYNFLFIHYLSTNKNSYVYYIIAIVYMYVSVFMCVCIYVRVCIYEQVEEWETEIKQEQIKATQRRRGWKQD